jgi:hypothetical protein
MNIISLSLIATFSAFKFITCITRLIHWGQQEKKHVRCPKLRADQNIADKSSQMNYSNCENILTEL